MPCVSMARRELECPLRRHVALAPLLGSERDDAVEVAHRRRVRRRGVVLVARRTPHGSRARPAEAVNSWQRRLWLEARKRARLLGRVLVHVTYTRFFAARAEWARGPHSVGAVRRNSTAGPIRILTVAVLQPAIGAHSRISTQERPQVRPTPTPLHHRHAFFAPFFTDRLPRDHAHPSIVSPKSARRSVPMPCYRSMV